MRRFWASISIIGIFLLIAAGIANATTIDFNDNDTSLYYYWPGWGNGSDDDSNDTIGTPDFTGGIAYVGSGLTLEGLSFDYKADEGLSYWHLLKPGDLFIDVDANDVWDYVVELNFGIDEGDYGLFSVSIPLAVGPYEESGNDRTGFWSSYYIRDDHPVGYNTSGISMGSVHFSGWQTPSDLGKTVSSCFNFDSNPIVLGDKFIIGWTVNCANDVIYETVNTPVPAPTTILLVGSGLLGLVAFVRKRRTP